MPRTRLSRLELSRRYRSAKAGIPGQNGVGEKARIIESLDYEPQAFFDEHNGSLKGAPGLDSELIRFCENELKYGKSCTRMKDGISRGQFGLSSYTTRYNIKSGSSNLK